jgi:tRNA A-37 threonylcarbamoyl transferase component Bud32
MGNLKRMKTILKRANKDISKETFADYDLRTPLHVAASDGSVGVTNWLIEQGVDLNPADRWGMTPLEGAVFGNHQDIIAMLQHAGGKIRDRETGTLLPIEESHVAASAAKDAKILTSDTMAWEIPDEELSDRVEVGAGAFGVVMRTRWRGTVIAMKQLHRHLHHDEVAKAEFRTELKLMRQLHHPHIVQFLGTSVDPGTGLVSLCFEFMHKGSLDQMFRRMFNSETGAPNITLAETVEMALDVARGMAYLHGRKPLPVIHRDLKPGNLMLTRAGRVKIGDFGLSKTMSVRHKMPQNLSENFSMTGETGSYRYMAPEVFRHEFYGTSVDVYAASMIYYQLFSFQQPFYGINPVDAAKLASMESLRPTMQKDLMPAQLARVVRAMWDADESKRPTFTQLIEILEPIASEYAAEEERRANKACCVVS